RRERVDVSDERRRESQIRVPGLRGRPGFLVADRSPAKELPFAAKHEVLLCQGEAIGGRLHRREPLARGLALLGVHVVQRGEQQTGCLVLTSSDPSSELMELRETETVGVL